jgi:hypothetical protein
VGTHGLLKTYFSFTDEERRLHAGLTHVTVMLE